MKYIALLILKILRVRIDTKNIPKEAEKCVLLFAPHTSAFDFVVGRLALTVMGVKTIFLIKKEMFWFPLGSLLKSLGGMPIDRKHVRNFTSHAANLIKEKNEIAFLIAPEGTRALNPKWKKGFYYIAQEANVPIVLGYLDYRSRRGGMGPVFYPTNNYEADIVEIEKFYYGMQGKHKGQFNLENYPYAHQEWLAKKR